MAKKPTFREDSWQKSSYCVGQSHCVEAATVDSVVGLRNSRQPEITLTFDAVEWQHFMDDLKSGAIRLDHSSGV